MRNFDEHQDAARRRTSWLLGGMLLAVFAMGGSVFGCVWLVRGFLLLRVPASAELPRAWQLGPIFGWCLGLTGLFIAVASAGRIWSLRRGGAGIAEMLEARLISGQPRDELDRRLLNVVTEMALAAGTPVPQLYVLDHERGINALAAGWDLGDAIVCVTRGSLEKLSRSELQGVIAHELSHVVHGDARLNLRLMGTVFGMVSVGLAGRQLMRAGHAARKNGAWIWLVGLALAVVGALGGAIGKLVKAAVSRQREFLADAAAVQFTRDPAAIAGALKKIGGHGYGSRIQSGRAEEASHFFFGDIGSAGFDSLAWMSTHPTLAERITRLEPDWDGAFITPDAPSTRFATRQQPGTPALVPGWPLPPPPQGTPLTSAGMLSMHPPGVVAARAAPQPSAAGYPIAAGPTHAQLHDGSLALAPTPAQPTPANDQRPDTDAAAPLDLPSRLQQLDPNLVAASESGLSACALVFALLSSAEPARAEHQAQLVAEHAGEALSRETQRLQPAVSRIGRPDRLILATLASPALHALSRAQQQVLRRTVEALSAEDGVTSVFEHVLGHVLATHWASSSERQARGQRQAALTSHTDAVQVVLSTLAHTGASFANAAEQAFAAALARLPSLSLKLLPVSPRLLSALGPALDALRDLRPTARAALLDACAHAMLADQRATEDEITVLQAVHLALDTPYTRVVRRREG